jgi:hypothetical protein
VRPTPVDLHEGGGRRLEGEPGTGRSRRREGAPDARQIWTKEGTGEQPPVEHERRRLVEERCRTGGRPVDERCSTGGPPAARAWTLEAERGPCLTLLETRVGWRRRLSGDRETLKATIYIHTMSCCS